MIHELSRESQYLTTTFRSELLVHADEFYGVFFDDAKISRIRAIERVNAEEFVETAA